MAICSALHTWPTFGWRYHIGPQGCQSRMESFVSRRLSPCPTGSAGRKRSDGRSSGRANRCGRGARPCAPTGAMIRSIYGSKFDFGTSSERLPPPVAIHFERTKARWRGSSGAIFLARAYSLYRAKTGKGIISAPPVRIKACLFRGRQSGTLIKSRRNQSSSQEWEYNE